MPGTIYQHIIESSTEAIVSLDLNGCFVVFNKAAEHLYGLKAENVLGKSFQILLVDEKQKKEAQILFNTMIKGDFLGELEMIYPYNDGSISHILVCPTPLFDKNNNIVGISAVIKKLTNTESKKKEPVEDFPLKEIPSYVSEDLESFACTVFHDLKSPLRAIGFLTHLTKEQLKENANIKADDYLKRIDESTHKLANLIDNMLNYIQVYYKNYPLEDVDMYKLIEDILKKLSKPQTWSFELNSSLTSIVTKKTPLKQVFQSLINSLISHQQDIENCRLLFKQEETKDNNISFSIQTLLPFSLVKNAEDNDNNISSTHKKPQRNIELAIAKKIIEHQGGDLKIDRDSKRGECYIFTWKKN